MLRGSITNSQSLNRYSYVQGKPVSYTDPFGLSPVEEIEEEKPNTGLLHAALGVLGFIPGPIGVVADLANAAVYAAVDHDYGMAALSVVSAVSSVAGSVAKVAAAEAGVAAKAGQTVAQVNALGRMAKATKVKSTFDMIGAAGRGVMATQRMSEEWRNSY